ncbi:MAG TPA: MoxR family ATPase [Acidimicrobiales bacterium]
MTDAAPPIRSLSPLRDALQAIVGRFVIGQETTLDYMIAAISVGGHVLLEGAPGVAKTLLAGTLAKGVAVQFRRVSFTPDMLPTDLTGTMVLRQGDLVFRQGPVFTNVLLADEINRTPPKTQAALLEAMQEGQVSIDGEPRRLPRPFLVLATQNPIEYEGTYPLPEAQLDRFFVRVRVDYPSEADERQILRLPRAGLSAPTPSPVDSAVISVDFDSIRSEVDATTVSEEVLAYIVGIARATRALPGVSLGASPRATTHLLAGAKATARLQGRDFVTPDDVVSMAEPVLAHRIVMTAGAELEGFSQAAAIASAVAGVTVPR